MPHMRYFQVISTSQWLETTVGGQSGTPELAHREDLSIPLGLRPDDLLAVDAADGEPDPRTGELLALPKSDRRPDTPDETLKKALVDATTIADLRTALSTWLEDRGVE